MTKVIPPRAVLMASYPYERYCCSTESGPKITVIQALQRKDSMFCVANVAKALAIYDYE